MTTYFYKIIFRYDTIYNPIWHNTISLVALSLSPDHYAPHHVYLKKAIKENDLTQIREEIAAYILTFKLNLGYFLERFLFLQNIPKLANAILQSKKFL